MRYLLEQEGSTEPDPPSYSASSTRQDEARTRIVELLNLYGDYPALSGLNLYDEPSSSLFGILGFAKEVLKRRAPRELPYVDVWPSCAAPSTMGAQTYEGYLDRYLSTVRPSLLCFKHYPLLAGGGITNSYFYNWATIRKFALRHAVPSWVFIQSVGIDNGAAGFADWRRPNKQELRSVGGSRIILSKYHKRGVADARYLFVANRSHAEAAKSRLVLSDSVRGVRRFDIGSGSFTNATLRRVNGHRYLGVRLAPGAARMYMLRT